MCCVVCRLMRVDLQKPLDLGPKIQVAVCRARQGQVIVPRNVLTEPARGSVIATYIEDPGGGGVTQCACQVPYVPREAALWYC